jgi:putative CocE/NonD family hydrolase
LLAQLSNGQKIFFPKAYYADSAAIARHIPVLARLVIDKYTEGNIVNYYGNLYKLQIVSGQYDSALGTLSKFDRLYTKQINNAAISGAIGFQYKIYCETIRGGPTEKGVFADDYAAKFEAAYGLIGNDAQNVIGFYFGGNLSDFKNDLEKKIAEVKGNDSLTIKDAVALCKNYCAYLVYGATLSLGKTEAAKIEKQNYIEDDSVLVHMPDGGIVSLAITRMRKLTNPQPVVMQYDIYAGHDLLYSKLIAQRGYIGIVANTRGKRLSPDTLEPMEHDAKDAYAIIDWISKQPWCNGKIGMYGGSYLGFSQWSSVKYLHPALKTIVPQVAVGAGVDFPMQNGVHMSYMLQWLHYVMDTKLTDDAGFNRERWDSVFGVWYKKGASFRSIDSLEGRPDPIWQRWLDHPDYDRFWQDMTPQKQEFAKVNIPIFSITGYWDDDQLGAMYYYKQYFAWNKYPDHYLLIGPYDHGGSQFRPSRRLGGYIIDSVANIPINDIVFQWFDHALKDGPLPPILQDRVNFEVMGANTWRHVGSLEQMHNDSLQFFLGNTPVGTAQTVGTGGKTYPLLKNRPQEAGYIEQDVDLAERSELHFKDGDIDAFDSLILGSLNTEKSKMIFVSDPVDQPFALSGSFKAVIDLIINKKDLDLVLDLFEQTPDGKYFALSENIQRASYAKDRSKRQLLQPGKAQHITIDDTFITCRQLQKGSRIVVMIGVNKNPSWEINYGTGGDVSRETIKDADEPLKIKWLNTSYIDFPILR